MLHSFGQTPEAGPAPSKYHNPRVNNQRDMTYIKQLDSIRAIAVFIVIVSHWLTQSALVKALISAQLGVNIFFVLSGFLITGILLKSRDHAEGAAAGKAPVVKNFFVRRSLRIFPIYYLTLFLLFVFASPDATSIRQSLGYYLTYTSNFYFYQIQSWDGMTSHLWSLAVEEQFYLLWPWAMLFLPKRALRPCIAAFIGVGIASSYLIPPENFGFVLPFSCFDAFGLGALLAYVLRYHGDSLPRFYRISGVLAGLCLVVLVVSFVWHQPTLIPSRTAQSVVTMWVIAHIVYRRKLGQYRFGVLDHPALVFLGRISYGLYLYHLPLAWDYPWLHHYVNRHLPAAVLRHEYHLVFVENFVLLVALSWLSYQVIEGPILHFKKYFEYHEAHAPALAK